MKNALFAVVGLLALSFVPVSGHAQMPGEKCGGADKVQVGTTKIATDSQSIIACLLTGNTAPGANVSEWKAMTSSNNGGGGGGNGGVTGGCFSYATSHRSGGVPIAGQPPAPRGQEQLHYYVQPSERWGNGCVNETVMFDNMPSSPCQAVASFGYSCGPTAGGVTSSLLTGNPAADPGDGTSITTKYCSCVHN